jgi:Zn-dependent protease
VLLALPWFYYQTRSLAATAISCVAFFFLLVAHELGHAAVARWRSVGVESIQLYFIHGLCTHNEPHSEEDDVLIAWGGVAAQFVVLAAAFGASLLVTASAPLAYSFTAPMFRVLIETNLFMIVVNLLPVAPLDGAKAWRALPLLAERAQRTRWGAGLRKLSAARARSRNKRLEARAQRITAEIIEKLKKGKSDA